MMNVISRLIGTHQLIILNFYGFLLKYLKPHQKKARSSALVARAFDARSAPCR
jgi:hypothetical protein